MIQPSLANQDWQLIVDRLGGAEAIESGARQAKAFLRARMIGNAVDLLRLVLAYCLGQGGLRSTAAWASAIGLVDISNVALLQRLRRSGDWLAALVGRAVASGAPAASRGRLIRLVDATAVPQAAAGARQKNGLWRIHSAFDLPAERFGFFELTDQHGGERLDRIPVEKGEIRIADRAYMQPERLAAVIAAGGEMLVRAGWKSACWLDGDGNPFDLIAELRNNAERGVIDRPIWVRRQHHRALRLRLVAVKKSAPAAEAARRAARRQAQKGGHQISQGTLAAADWVILITSLTAQDFPTADILALYRLRWRIELAFKRLKSLVGLRGPPGIDERSARPYVLAHLLMILVLEPLVDELGDSPRSAAA
jgi:Transposase DDE domain